MHREISRRAILAGGTALLAAAQAEQQAQRKLKVAIFSKHLQFLQGAELALAAMGPGTRGHHVVLLGQLRHQGRPEWRGPSDMAGVGRGEPAGDPLRRDGAGDSHAAQTGTGILGQNQPQAVPSPGADG